MVRGTLGGRAAGRNPSCDHGTRSGGPQSTTGTGGRRPRRRLAAVLAAVTAAAGLTVTAAPAGAEEPVVAQAATGVWLTATDGGVFSFGSAPFYGSTGNITLNQPIVGITATQTGNGYWFVAADGGIFAYGDAQFSGSMGGTPLNQPVVGMAARPGATGYWLVARDGGIFSFGGAPFFGSTGNITLNQPIVGMTPTATGNGYWFVAADGGIFAFGDAAFLGSAGNLVLAQPVVGMATTPTGGGYWLVTRGGQVLRFGDAANHGDASAQGRTDVVGIVPSDAGYWLVTSGGDLLDFGDAAALGGVGIPLNRPVVGGTARQGGPGVPGAPVQALAAITQVRGPYLDGWNNGTYNPTFEPPFSGISILFPVDDAATVDDGGDPIEQRYEARCLDLTTGNPSDTRTNDLDYTPAVGPRLNSAGPTTLREIIVAGLFPGHEYECSYRATNDAGPGPWSVPAKDFGDATAVTAATVPLPPVSVVLGDDPSSTDPRKVRVTAAHDRSNPENLGYADFQSFTPPFTVPGHARIMAWYFQCELLAGTVVVPFGDPAGFLAGDGTGWGPTVGGAANSGSLLELERLITLPDTVPLGSSVRCQGAVETSWGGSDASLVSNTYVLPAS